MILEKGGKLSRTRSRGFPFIAIICLQITEDDTENTKEKENHAGHGDSKPHSKHNLFNKSFGTMMPIPTPLFLLRVFPRRFESVCIQPHKQFPLFRRY